ncbi:hypothetical protein [Nocardiopsis ansamitocini]|uniref:Uncharacterized protein n=1 Tax=Nocardiopsis ansamitocini TaxID=1670832 RepID=A0A9W6P5I9_9ACTN|nr:hypothetical protein [Nocardiopsis ansamitocini]GLU47789.1 hypothetical protein Nans01_21400 [Nocardiopsis ansamitocini]
MGQALARHRADRIVADPMLTGRFLCPVSRWDELCAGLGPGEQVDVGLILDTEQALLGGVAVADSRVRVTHYEVRAPGAGIGKALRPLVRTGADGRGTPGEGRVRLPVYFEFDRGPEGRGNLAGLAGAAGLRAKVRCGGARADLFPGATELAAFIGACAEHGVPFKATAGLHHAVRHTDPSTGFVHHGYLNLLSATAAVLVGEGEEGARRELLRDDPAALAERVLALDEDTAVEVRELFIGYGSCSTRDPVTDARELGLLDPPR